MKNNGQFRVRKQTQKDYCFPFKLQVVEEGESGALSQDGYRRKYRRKGNATILRSHKIS
jgi:hypothetical protein